MIGTPEVPTLGLGSVFGLIIAALFFKSAISNKMTEAEDLIILLTDEIRATRRDCCWHQKGCEHSKRTMKLTAQQLQIARRIIHAARGDMTVAERRLVDSYEATALESGQRLVDEPEPVTT